MRFYLDWGLRVAAGQWTDHQAFYGLPGYAYWLGAVLALSGGSVMGACLITGVLQAAAFAAVGTLVFLLTRDALLRVRPDQGTLSLSQEGAQTGGCIAAACWALFTPAQAFSVVLMPTIGFTLVFWGTVYFLMSHGSARPWWQWGLLGIAMGACSMFVAAVLFLTPLAIVRIILERKDPRFLARIYRTSGFAAILICGVIAGLSPAWLHNELAARESVMLSAHSGINLYIGNNPEANGYPKIPVGLRANQAELLQDSLRIPEQELGRRLSRVEVSEFWANKATEWISQNPAEWRKLVLRKFQNFWNAFQYDDVNVLQHLRREGTTFGFSSFGLIAAFGIPAGVWGWWRVPPLRWAIAAILLHMVAILPVFVTERYRLPIIPGMISCAVVGLTLLWQGFNSGRWSFVGAYLVAVVGSTSFTSIQKGSPEAWALRHYSLGVRSLAEAEGALARKDVEDASAKLKDAGAELRSAFQYAPASTETNLALGNLFFAQGDRSRARLMYSRTVQLAPDHASAWTNLGVIALQDIDTIRAITYLSTAARANPGSGKVYFLLAKARAQAGDLEGARADVKHALTLRPNQREFQAFLAELERPL